MSDSPTDRNNKSLYCSILFFSGLSMSGYGLFSLYGIGTSLAVSGGVLVIVSIIGAMR